VNHNRFEFDSEPIETIQNDVNVISLVPASTMISFHPYDSRMVLKKHRNSPLFLNGIVLMMIFAYVHVVMAWIQPSFFPQQTLVSHSLLSAVSSDTSTTNKDVATLRQDCKAKMLEYSQQTQSGQSSTSRQLLHDEIETCLQTLEQTVIPSNGPPLLLARNPLVFGTWSVRYTNAPPPSNGQLGIFSGQAYQTVKGNCYTNLLEVPPNRWLTAALQATWQEWDGTLLDKQVSVTANRNNSQQQQQQPLSSSSSSSSTSSSSSNTIDYGATCWKVTFETLKISLFGIQLFQQIFPPTTQRIWRTTYVDDDTRIVRAGTTGLPEDEFVFYMTRV
jgi:hypothetical protein